MLGGMKSWMRFVVMVVLAAAFLATGMAVHAATCTPSTLDGAEGFTCLARKQVQAFVEPEPRAGSILSGVTYGWIEDYARFYAAPEERAEWVRTASAGFFYGPVEERSTDEAGNEWLKVWGNWLPARYFHEVQTSSFAGVKVNVQPRRPFGWVLREVVVRSEPAGPAEEGARILKRYDLVQVYDRVIGGDGAPWYDIGGSQWVRYHALAIVTLQEPPRDVGEDAFWVDVDLSQQIFAAYEGQQLVFAGLISSGLPRWPTRRGLFQVRRTYLTTPMVGGEVGDDYYYLEDVPHTMFFDRDIALHGAYWHDDFGRPKSHGCVNIAPRAAEWLYDWAMGAEGAVWVRVR